MTKRGKVLLALALCLILLTSQLQTTQANSLIPDTLVQHTQADTMVVPDAYNTGCKGILTPVSVGEDGTTQLYDLTLSSGNNGEHHVFDFYYRNGDISGTIYIENYDFSTKPLSVFNESKVDREIKLIFKNCKFSSVGVGSGPSCLSYEFYNCTFNSFYGSNAIFSKCRFGNSNSDGIVPFGNVQVNDCFFGNMAGEVSDKGRHIDGTQIYGHEGIDVENVHFTNCRFEVPPLAPAGTKDGVNACIMLFLEYSSGDNISFNNIYVNGGGYTIYAGVKYDGLTLTNASFNNIRFGAANRYGVFYPGSPETVTKNNILSTDSLYVGSVWKENGQTHFSVTNDTNRERTLFICTDTGAYTYTIPACLTSGEITSATTYDDFPFDMDIVVPADCEYAVCFDNTVPGCGMQLRFVNWSGREVHLGEDIINTLYGGNEEPYLQGQCGNNVTFTLKSNGTLLLEGTGSTYAYHSGKQPEWETNKDLIKEVYVSEGITDLGGMLFRSCSSLRSVSLPSTIKNISARAFQDCSSLQAATYAGTAQDWAQIAVGSYNDDLLSVLSFQPEATPTPVPTTEPTVAPTTEPTVAPTAEPTVAPTAEPTVAPTAEPTVAPTAEPTIAPTVEPTVAPTAEPTIAPTAEPTVSPTTEPTVAPTAEPTVAPTAEPTVAPTAEPTMAPTAEPTMAPTVEPTIAPTAEPTSAPTTEPTSAPTTAPTVEPTSAPTMPPSVSPPDAPAIQATTPPVVAPNASNNTLDAADAENQTLENASQSFSPAPKMGEDATVLFILYVSIFCLILLAIADTIIYQYQKRFD